MQKIMFVWWMILQAEEAEDWVIATGTTTTIRDFVKMAFSYIGIELEFTGKGINEKATIFKCNNPSYQLEIGKEILSIDPKYFRPTEVETLLGDASKAKEKLNWVSKISFEQLVREMIDEDLKLAKNDNLINL